MADADSPLQLVAGGSGIVPLMAMLRHRALAARGGVARLLYSSRTWETTIYRDELGRLARGDERLGVVHTLTRAAPSGWSGPTRRVDRPMLEEHVLPPSDAPDVFVCGPTPFVETVASTLVELGHAPARIKTERFGPTGGST